MSDMMIHERLRQARIGRGEAIETLARRIGVRSELLRTIEEGRFAELPRGIYARAAIRSYASAMGFDPEEVLAVCEPFLPAVEDPIGDLARLRGLRPFPPRIPTRQAAAPVPVLPAWQILAAAAVDALVVVVLVLLVIVCTITAGIPLAALGRAAAPAFSIVGGVLGACYFVLFGGIAGATAGDLAAGLRLNERGTARVDLRAVAERALRCASRDLSFIQRIGERLGSFTAPDGQSRGSHDNGRAEQPARS